MEEISKLTPILYEMNETNFNHNGLGKLTNLLVNDIEEVLNGEFEAFFEYPANGRLAHKIDNKMLIKAKPNTKDNPHVFRVYDYELDTFNQTYLIYARSKNIDDLGGNMVLDVNVRNQAPNQAWNQAVNNALEPVNIRFESDITTRTSAHWERRNLLSIIAGQEESMIQYWGGEIKHGNGWLWLYRRRGQDNVTTVRHGKNLEGLIATYSTKGLITAIVPYYVKRGRDGADDTTIYGNTVQSQYVNNYPHVYYDTIEYNNEELGLDRDEEPENGWSKSTIRSALNRVSERYFIEHTGIDLPAINMEINLEDISKTKEYEHFKNFEQIEIGDTITVYSKKFHVHVTAKVRRVVYDGLTDMNKVVEVGTVSRSIYDDYKDLVNNRVEESANKLQEGIDHAMTSANGKNTTYHGTADPNEAGLIGQNNDNYFRTNGQLKELWIYRDGMWHLEVGDLTGEQIRADVEQAQADIESAREQADEAVEQIDTAVANAGFTSLDETISSVQTISNQAQINSSTAIDNALEAMNTADTAIDNALEAMQQASQAVENTGSLNVRVDEVENTLSVKADKQTVDDLTGVVDLQALDIKANADGLKLKANQDTVDLIDGRVSSLGTEVGVVAGQISSKVWNTDIESAIDGIEVGGRNLVRNSNFNSVDGWRRVTGYIIGVDNNELTFKALSNSGWNALMSDGDNRVYLEKDFQYTLSYEIFLLEPLIPTNSNIILGFSNYGLPDSGTLISNNVTSQLDGNLLNEWQTIKTTVYSDVNEYVSAYLRFGYPKDDALIKIRKVKIEKGNKATDWTPAPEDTLARFDHIETEWTQTFDSFSQTVSSIDGRVTAQTQEIDRITRTIQDVTEDVEGNTTKINQTVSTVDKHTQTIATINKDLDGKVETSDYNTLVSTVDSTIRRIGDAEGNITQVEQNVNGLRTTVAGKASQSEVTQLSNAVNTKVTSSQVNTLIKTDKTIKDTRDKNETPKWYYDNYSKETVREFKELTVMGISGEGTYGILETVIPWSDSSGGGIKQTLTTDHAVHERSGTGTTWTEWKKTADVDWVGAQVSVLEDNINLRVKKGDTLSQINIEANRTLIQSDKLYLDAQTVSFGGQAFIPSAAITALSADKITAGTINGNQIRVINLDASSISSGRIEGIEIIAETGYIAGWDIYYDRLEREHNGKYTILKGGGEVALATGVPRSGGTTGDGTLMIFHDGSIGFNGSSSRISTDVNSNLIIRSNNKLVLRSSDYIEIQGNMYPTGEDYRLGADGRRMRQVWAKEYLLNPESYIRPSGVNGMLLRSAGRLYLKPDSFTVVEGDLAPHASGVNHLGFNDRRWSMVYTTSGVSESSDYRLKEDIQNIPKKLIEEFKEIEPKMYHMNGKTQFGYIAQDIERALFKYATAEYGVEVARNNNSTFNIVSKDDSYLSLIYRQITAIKDAEYNQRINQLENRIKELENAN